MSISRRGIQNKEVDSEAWRIQMREKEARIVAVEYLQWVDEFAEGKCIRGVMDMQKLTNAKFYSNKMWLDSSFF
eukprot:4417108-Karenia_brevis.AAC.1